MEPNCASGPPRRSGGALSRSRIPLPWPAGRPFRILAIDGGGIRGIFPAAFLAGLERRFLRGRSVGEYFDIIAGTSTGGILALGLASGHPASTLRDVYVQRGCEIFPPLRRGVLGRLERALRSVRRCFSHLYNREALERVLQDALGDRTLRDARARLCIPSFDGQYGEVYIFKTPHHPDYARDCGEPMTKVAAATGAAPTYYRPLQDGGYTFVDGGVWANNPVMIALVDALTCFDIPRDAVRILSLGCGGEPYTVAGSKVRHGGMIAWRDIISAAMNLQSQNALGQAGLLIGANRVIRVTPTLDREMELDDWTRASRELPAAARTALDRDGSRVAETFLSGRTARPVFYS